MTRSVSDLRRAQDIGNRVRQLRRAQHLSQRTLARLAPIAFSSLQALETGSRVPRPTTIDALARALKVSPDQLDPAVAPDPVAPTAVAAPPFSYVGFNQEDLLVARAYNRAPTEARQRVQQILAQSEAARFTGGPHHGVQQVRLAALLHHLEQVDPAQCAETVQAFVEHLEGLPQPSASSQVSRSATSPPALKAKQR